MGQTVKFEHTNDQTSDLQTIIRGTFFGQSILSLLALITEQEQLRNRIEYLTSNIMSGMEKLSEVKNRINDIKTAIIEIEQQKPTTKQPEKLKELEQRKWQLITDRDSLIAALKESQLEEILAQKQCELQQSRARLANVSTALDQWNMRPQTLDAGAIISQQFTYAHP